MPRSSFKKMPLQYSRRAQASAPTKGRIRVTSGMYTPLGAFGQKRAPTPVELVMAWRNATYVCSMINAVSFASQPLRLYITTTHGKGEKATERFRTKTVPASRAKYLAECPTISKKLESADRVDEVMDHPIIKLLDNVNPWFDRFQLFKATCLYQDIVGRAFWYKVAGLGGRPQEIWPLPSWMVNVQRDYVGTNVIDSYLFTGGGGQAVLPTKDVLFFRQMSLFDPYADGFSALSANYQPAQIQDKLLDYRDATVTNRGRPDAMLIPTGEGADTFGFSDPAVIQRIQFEYEQSMALGSAGKLWVPPGNTKLEPINWSPVDMGEIEMERATLHAVARGMNIPIPLVDGEAANRANYDASLLTHARYCVRPRCREMEETLNSNFVPLWDDSGRLFLAYDDPVPADKVLERETNIAYVKEGIRSRNAVRAEIGEDPDPDGDELVVPAGYTTLAALVKLASNPQPEPVAPGKPGDPDKPDEGADDEPFDEGDDQESDRAGKGLNGEGEHRFPFSVGKAAKRDKVPSAHAILGGSLKSLGLTDRFLAGTITPKQRFKLLHQVRLDARAWLRAEAQKILDKYATEPVEKALLGRAKEAVGKFFGKARRFIREAALAGTLAVLGPEPANQAELFAMNQGIEAQYTFLAAFKREIEEEQKPIDPAFVARAEQYGASTWPIAVNTIRESAKVSGVFHEERRIHVGPDVPCDTCIAEEGKGWVPIGTLAPIGASICRTSCHCHYIFRVGEDDPTEYTAGRGPMHEPAFGQYYDPGGVTSAPVAAPPKPRPKPNALGVTFTRSPKAADAKEPTVLVNVPSLDVGWQKDVAYYIPPGGGDDKQKYQNAVNFIVSAISSGDPVEQSRISVDKDGSVSFLDGRHRFAALRDLGATSVPVSVDKPDAARARRLHGEPK